MFSKTLSAIGAAFMTLTVFSGTVAIMDLSANSGVPMAQLA